MKKLIEIKEHHHQTVFWLPQIWYLYEFCLLCPLLNILWKWYLPHSLQLEVCITIRFQSQKIPHIQAYHINSEVKDKQTIRS